MSVGGFELTKKTYIIIIIVGVLAVAAVVGYLSMQPSTAKKVKDSEIVTVTVLNNIGIDRITIKNMNTGDSIGTTIIDLPYTFNCSRGTYLKLSATVTEDFQWNAWTFPVVGTFDNSNPSTFVVDGNIVVNNKVTIEPKCYFLEISPTFTPNPTPHPTPTPVE